MVTEKLIINGVDVPLINGIGTVLTYSIKDIEQPDKRKASFSKTIKLPGSKVLNDLFNFIFEINSDSTFNPNLKADAIYLINDIAVFKGILQLKKINKLDNEHYTYDVVLLGDQTVQLTYILTADPTNPFIKILTKIKVMEITVGRPTN